MSLSAYIRTLTITQGAGAGEPIQLLPWQRRFLAGFERTDGDVALSIARGAGKSTLTGAIATACVAGPLAMPRAEVVCVASSFAQGRIVFEHVLAFLQELGHDLNARKTWRVQDSANVATVEYRPTGSRVRCIGSDPARAHGLAPVLVVADEPAMWPPGLSDKMRAALGTAMGKIPGSRMVAIGTRPRDESHWFAHMLESGADYSQCYAAGDNDSPFQRRTWLKANPSLAIMPALEARMRKEVELARRDTSELAAFRAFRLNQGTDEVERGVLLDAALWRRIEGDAEVEGRPIWGLDLGQSAAMSACAAFWPSTGHLARIRHRFGISSSLCWYWTRIGSRYPSWVVRRYARRVFGPFQERLLPVHRATLTWIANGGRAPTSASRRCSVDAVQRWSSYPGSRHSGSRCRFASTSAKTLA